MFKRRFAKLESRPKGTNKTTPPIRQPHPHERIRNH